MATKEQIAKGVACCVERDVFNKPYGRFLSFIKALERIPKKDRDNLKTQYYKQVTKVVRVPSHLAAAMMEQVAKYVEHEKGLTIQQISKYTEMNSSED